MMLHTPIYCVSLFLLLSVMLPTCCSAPVATLTYLLVHARLTVGYFNFNNITVSDPPP